MLKYLPYFICIMLLSIVIIQCDKNAEVTPTTTEILSSDTMVRHYKNNLGFYTARVATLQTENDGLNNLIIKKDKELSKLAKEFKSIKSFIKLKNVAIIDSVRVSYKDSIPYKFERHGIHNDKWYSLKFYSDQNGLKIDSLAIWTETSIITGVTKKWLLGRQHIVTDVTNSNPYISITDLKAAEVIIPEPWYRKWYVWLGIGITGGFLVK